MSSSHPSEPKLHPLPEERGILVRLVFPTLHSRLVIRVGSMHGERVGGGQEGVGHDVHVL